MASVTYGTITFHEREASIDDVPDDMREALFYTIFWHLHHVGGSITCTTDSTIRIKVKCSKDEYMKFRHHVHKFAALRLDLSTRHVVPCEDCRGTGRIERRFLKSTSIRYSDSHHWGDYMGYCEEETWEVHRHSCGICKGRGYTCTD